MQYKTWMDIRKYHTRNQTERQVVLGLANTEIFLAKHAYALRLYIYLRAAINIK